MGILLSGSDIDRAIKRISHEIIEHNQGISNLVLMGIPTRGAYLANRIAAFIGEIEGEVASGVLDITLHRDDLRLRPPKPILPTKLPAGGIEGKDLVLVDDVLFSGRTIRAALDAIGEVGRPKTVQLAVLVDRGHHYQRFAEKQLLISFLKIPPVLESVLKLLLRGYRRM
ncbi:MAG: bifunctional pyr operon transcriptional regulator/uracil phosphoribosyltransferase PyrR [Actinobacteria bacterium]|nr:bifunctional pyr operon transcriptional regulator/uracil phosphoribosyltransferase PyrR [Actinomycetota bacterium]